MNVSAVDFAKFKAELSYSAEKVPFYRSKLKSMGVNILDINCISDITKVPPTEKKDYRKNFPMGVLAEGFSLDQSFLTRSQSSGTTGDRLITFEIGMLLLQRAISCAGINPHIEGAFTQPGRKIVRYAAPNCSDVECANPNSTMEDRILPDGTLVLPVYHDLLTTSEVLIERAIDEIISFKPDLYYVDPTHFAFLLRQFKKRGIEPPIAPIVATYSTPTQVSLRQIADYFPMALTFAELMASSEMGWVGLACPLGKLHLNRLSYFFEIIDNGVPVKSSEIGEMYITSLDNGAIPHVRYKTGDMFSFSDEKCPCGCEFETVVMEGRRENFIKQDNQLTLSPRAVDSIIGAPKWLEQYQLHQRLEKDFTLKLITDDTYQSGDEAEILAALKKKLLSDSKIVFECVEYIASERSGKFQFVKSDVKIN